MTRNDFLRLTARAAEIGAEAAWDEQAEVEYEAEGMADRDCDDRRYVYGCGEYDTVDSRGRALRPTYNEAGEHWTM